jgi:hypothetical protein
MPYGPNEYDTLAYGNGDLVAEEERLAERKALLQQRALASARQLGIYAQPGPPVQTEGFRSAVTGGPILGPAIRTPLLSKVNPLLQETRDVYDRGQLATDASGYRRMEAQLAQDHMARMPRTTYDSGPEGPVMREPTQADKLTWARAGMQLPSLRNTMQQYIADQVIKEPERIEAREERKLTREEARAAAEAKQREELEYRRQRDKEAADLKRELAEQAADLRRDLFRDRPARGTWHKTSTDPATGKDWWENFDTGERRLSADKPAEKPAKPLPVGTANAWRENSVALAKVDDALLALETKAGKGATGWKGYTAKLPFGSKALNWFNPDGTATRALIADIGSLKLHDRSGANVTASESPRLVPFIPEITDDADVVRKKLRNFKREYEFVQQEIQNYAEDEGYIVPKARTRDNSIRGNLERGLGVTPSAPSTPSDLNAEFSKEPSVREAVEAAIREHEPTGNFTGSPEDVLRQIRDIKDPVERDLALRAYANQVTGAKSGESAPSVRKYNRQTGEFE